MNSIEGIMQSRNVKILASQAASGGIDFDVDGVKAAHAWLKLDKDSGKHSINFELHDKSGRNLKFDAADPIWISEDCPCPPAAGINSDQIDITDTAERSLQVQNGNWGRARELRYQLNFIAEDGSRAACDPVIQNGGGIKS
jgi:hypothetical protein